MVRATATGSTGMAAPFSAMGALEAVEAFRDLLHDEALPDSYGTTIAEVLGPLAGWVMRRHAELGRCCVVGLCGPQGSGKSTAVRVLQHMLTSAGLRSAVLSIDDLYFSRQVREGLARDVHPLLVTRGPPGTHDAALGERVIDDLRAGRTVRLPRFDKAVDDLYPEEAWDSFAGPADIILFEGWCVGARPQPDAALAEPINRLEREEDAGAIWRAYVNKALAGYQGLFASLDLLIQLAPPSFEVVLRWREEQEAKLRRASASSPATRVMDSIEIRRFVEHFERLTRHILREMPQRANAIVELDENRLPVSLQMKLARMRAAAT